MTDSDKDLEVAIRSFEERHSLRKNFAWNMKDEDDWSFIIKAHACFEAILTNLIIVETNRQELTEFIGRSPIYAEYASKMRLESA